MYVLSIGAGTKLQLLNPYIVPCALNTMQNANYGMICGRKIVQSLIPK